MPPTVSIIIVTFNSAAHLPALAASLDALRYDPAPELVLVDNASHDESAALARSLLPHALHLPQARNLGFAGGVNVGVAHSRGEIVVLLNPDAAVAPDWLGPLVAALDAPGVGLAGSKILDGAGELLHHTGGIVERPLLLTKHRGDGEADRGQYDTAEDVPFVTGASLALRRALWDELGGLDVGFFPGYFEDLDLCVRVQARGLTCRYMPASVLRHVESTATGRYSGAFFYYYLRNRWRFACKHLPWPELWGGFCAAEAARLSQEAPALDRLIAALIYREGLGQGLALPDEAEQNAILATGRLLGQVPEAQQHTPMRWPAEVRQRLLVDERLAQQLQAARDEALLREHEFRSALPGLGALRRVWNNVATRWYVLPVLHQQTRFNLAASRSLDLLGTQSEVGGVPLGVWVYQAAMLYRLHYIEERRS